MPLPFSRARVVGRLAQHLRDYLPGSGAAHWRGHVCFASVAQQQGVGAFWQGGSKVPSITQLLELTLERRPDRFQPLVLAIVNEGLRYRERNGQPISRKDIEQLNRLIADLGFKFPELWSERFLDTLPDASRLTPADARGEDGLVEPRPTLQDFKLQLLALRQQSDRQAAGLALEKLLTEVFALSNLAPRGSFRVTGEQVDGSLVLDAQIYLVEAKWERDPIGEGELLVFSGKVAGKSTFTRGLFISLSGYSDAGLKAI